MSFTPGLSAASSAGAPVASTEAAASFSAGTNSYLLQDVAQKIASALGAGDIATATSIYQASYPDVMATGAFKSEKGLKYELSNAILGILGPAKANSANLQSFFETVGSTSTATGLSAPPPSTTAAAPLPDSAAPSTSTAAASIVPSGEISTSAAAKTPAPDTPAPPTPALDNAPPANSMAPPAAAALPEPLNTDVASLFAQYAAQKKDGTGGLGMTALEKELRTKAVTPAVLGQYLHDTIAPLIAQNLSVNNDNITITDETAAKAFIFAKKAFDAKDLADALGAAIKERKNLGGGASSLYAPQQAGLLKSTVASLTAQELPTINTKYYDKTDKEGKADYDEFVKDVSHSIKKHKIESPIAVASGVDLKTWTAIPEVKAVTDQMIASNGDISQLQQIFDSLPDEQSRMSVMLNFAQQWQEAQAAVGNNPTKASKLAAFEQIDLAMQKLPKHFDLYVSAVRQNLKDNSAFTSYLKQKSPGFDAQKWASTAEAADQSALGSGKTYEAFTDILKQMTGRDLNNPNAEVTCDPSAAITAYDSLDDAQKQAFVQFALRNINQHFAASALKTFKDDNTPYDLRAFEMIKYVLGRNGDANAVQTALGSVSGLQDNFNKILTNSNPTISADGKKKAFTERLSDASIIEAVDTPAMGSSTKFSDQLNGMIAQSTIKAVGGEINYATFSSAKDNDKRAKILKAALSSDASVKSFGSGQSSILNALADLMNQDGGVDVAIKLLKELDANSAKILAQAIADRLEVAARNDQSKEKRYAAGITGGLEPHDVMLWDALKKFHYDDTKDIFDTFKQKILAGKDNDAGKDEARQKAGKFDRDGLDGGGLTNQKSMIYKDVRQSYIDILDGGGSSAQGGYKYFYEAIGGDNFEKLFAKDSSILQLSKFRMRKKYDEGPDDRYRSSKMVHRWGVTDDKSGESDAKEAIQREILTSRVDRNMLKNGENVSYEDVQKRKDAAVGGIIATYVPSFGTSMAGFSKGNSFGGDYRKKAEAVKNGGTGKGYNDKLVSDFYSKLSSS